MSAAWRVALLLWWPGTARPDAGYEVPPDLSLSVAEYVALGVADPARPWSRASRDAAREILWSLRERDPALLPRAGSPRSDAVFRRLVSESLRVSIEENFGVSLDALAEMSPGEVSRARRTHSLIGVYLPSPDDRLASTASSSS